MDPSIRTICGLLAVIALLGVMESVRRGIIRASDGRVTRMTDGSSMLLLQIVAIVCLLGYIAALAFGITHAQIAGWLSSTGTYRRVWG